MRFLLAVLSTLALAQCASSDDERFHVGQSPRAFIIIGVAETSTNTSARYDVLWRRVNDNGAFEEIDDDTAIEAQTNAGDTLRVRGIPGEFTLREVAPGTYALDSVFAVIRDRRVNYVANGVIEGPERPSFEVRAGEAVYLGIWQADIDDAAAVVRPWRVSEADLRIVLAQQNNIRGDVRIRTTEPLSVACAPRRLNNLTQRQVC